MELLWSEELSSLEVLELTVNALSDAVKTHAKAERVAPTEAWESVVKFINNQIKDNNWRIEKSDKKGFEYVIKKTPKATNVF